MNAEIRRLQEQVCARFGIPVNEYPGNLNVGVSRNVRDGAYPINGVRVNPEGDTTGWYIWAGEWSDDPDFFVPLHAGHLHDCCPLALPFLLLPVGWRFQVAPDYEDAWPDPEVEP